MVAHTPLPQLTLKAILLGLLLSMVLAGANAYLGLFAVPIDLDAPILGPSLFCYV